MSHFFQTNDFLNIIEFSLPSLFGHALFTKYYSLRYLLDFNTPPLIYHYLSPSDILI